MMSPLGHLSPDWLWAGSVNATRPCYNGYMEHNLKIVLEVQVDAPTEMDAYELIHDFIGDAYGINVASIDIKKTRKKK